MIMAAALVAVSVIVATGDGKPFADAYCKAVSKVIDGACSGGGDGTGETEEGSPFEYQPAKCKVRESSEKANSVVKIVFIELGENAGFTVTEYSDGTVKVTATDGGEIGATGGVGAEAEFGSGKVGAKVDFGGGLKFDYGSSWNFNSMEEAEAFQQQFQDYQVYMMQITNPDIGLGALFIDEVDPPPPPHENLSSVAVTGDVTGSLGLTINGPKGSNAKGAGVQATGELGEKWITRTTVDQTPNDGTDNTLTTYTTEVSAKGGVSGSAVVYGAGANGYLGGTMSITKDAQGRITNITFTSTVEGGTEHGPNVNIGGKGEGGSGSGKGKGSNKSSEATVVTTSLDLDPNNADQQAIASEWLGSNITDVDLANGLLLNPAESVPGNEFQNLLHEQAQVHTVTYDNVRDGLTFGLEVKLGIALGFEVGYENSEATATSASYLGAPNANGVREPVDWPECVGG